MSSIVERLLVPPESKTILELIRAEKANTRRDLARLTGLSRSTLSQRLSPLLESGLIVTGSDFASMGGRPPSSLVFNPRAGYVLVADSGVTHTHTGVTDLNGQLMVEEQTEVPIEIGPDQYLTWLEAKLEEHIESLELGRETVRGIGVGLPGPVEHDTGRPVSPPIMPGWDGYGVGDRLARSFGIPALIDNDVNIMAVGEHRRALADVSNMIFVKVSSGIGSGLILSSSIHRGAHGAAGDIGHIYVPGHDAVRCSCGNIGCLEAVASASALAKRFGAIPVRELTSRLMRGEPDAVSALREAGREIGAVLAALVNITDPEVIVIGGELAEADQPLIAGIREVIYRRSVPLATHNLRILKSTLGEDAGIIGAGILVAEHLLSLDHPAEPARGSLA